MKRRPHGVNLDDGSALSSAEDFDRLFVAGRTEEDERLREWLADPEAAALIVAGQIGTGKTTLLNNLLRQATESSVVRVEFDQVPLEETLGAFLGVLFGALVKEALRLGCRCNALGVALSDFGLPGRASWERISNLLLAAPASLAKASQVRSIYAVFGQNEHQGKRGCARLIELIKTKTGVWPAIIAEGVDKFDISRSGYLGLVEILNFLHEYKTLYEANAIHLFDEGRRWVTSDKLLIGPLPDETVVEMYERRLGSYAPIYGADFPHLVQFAGGNARQALRMLNSFYFHRTQRGQDRAGALALAAHRVTQDLLQFGFTRFPAETLAVFKRDGYVEGALLSKDLEHRQEARDILYRNWAFLCSSPAAGTTRWPLFINPLVSDAIVWEKSTPEPPELRAARQWARDHHMSPMGLTMPEEHAGRPRPWAQIWEQLSSTESSEDKLNIIRLLEEVASSLFSANRQDRVVVSYRDPQNLSIALDYLIGKAASYGPFLCRELHLVGGDGEDPIATLMTEIKDKDSATVYAVFMEGAWTSQQLDGLERLRDRFVDVQMLWFVDHSALLGYLRYWPQFRQLLRFYVLEDDFLSSLSKEEIDADLSVLSSLIGPEGNGITRLKRVLFYLEQGGRKA